MRITFISYPTSKPQRHSKITYTAVPVSIHPVTEEEAEGHSGAATPKVEAPITGSDAPQGRAPAVTDWGAAVATGAGAAVAVNIRGASSDQETSAGVSSLAGGVPSRDYSLRESFC